MLLKRWVCGSLSPGQQGIWACACASPMTMGLHIKEISWGEHYSNSNHTVVCLCDTLTAGSKDIHLTTEEWPPLSSVTGATVLALQCNVRSPPLHSTMNAFDNDPA